MRITALTAGVIFVLDQVTKWFVVHAMNLRMLGEIEVLPPYLVFRMAWNTGINFGLMAGQGGLMRWVLVVLALGISSWVVAWVRRERLGRAGEIAAGLLVGGAIGNALDRVVYGAVADFLNMSCCGIRNPYSFNVADIAVFAGAIGLILFTGGTKNRA